MKNVNYFIVKVGRLGERSSGRSFWDTIKHSNQQIQPIPPKERLFILVFKKKSPYSQRLNIVEPYYMGSLSLCNS